MEIIQCNPTHTDLAVYAMVSIKCIVDGSPVGLATYAVMKSFLENPLNYLLIAVDGEMVVAFYVTSLSHIFNMLLFCANKKTTCN